MIAALDTISTALARTMSGAIRAVVEEPVCNVIFL
jgi:hypothetical protein